MYLFSSFNKQMYNSFMAKQNVQILDACVVLDGSKRPELINLIAAPVTPGGKALFLGNSEI